MRQILQAILLSVLCVACASQPKPDVTVEGVSETLSNLKKAVAFAIPGGIRAQAPNGRTFVSHYVGLDGNKWDALSSDAQRAFAEVTILGDRRPYTITIRAHVEERRAGGSSSGFRRMSSSKKMAEVVAQRMRYFLEDRRNQRNVIDDFRPF